jgi:hypothetical protein
MCPARKRRFAMESRATAANQPEVDVCPYCGQPLLNHDAVTHLERSQREAELQLVAAAHAEAARMVQKKTAKLEEATERLQKQLADEKTQHADEIHKVKTEVRAAAQAEAEKDAQATVRSEVRAKDRLILKFGKQVESQAHQIQQAKTQHADEIRKLKIDLRATAQTEARKTAEAEVRGELRAKNGLIRKFEEQIATQARQIEHLTSDERGEVNELALVGELHSAFPDDQIQRLGRGNAGGDILHTVRVQTGEGLQDAGLIVYECKDTQKWNNTFLDQARKEGITHGTPYIVIITRAFPHDEKTIFVRDDVVIVHPSRAVDIAKIMRRLVAEIHRVDLTANGKAAKTAELYDYLASLEFRQSFDALADAGQRLDDLLGKEQKWHEQTWSKRRTIYSEIGRKTASIDARIRSILERDASQQGSTVSHLPARRQAS